MHSIRTRVFGAGALSFAIETTSRAQASFFEDLFRDLDEPPDSAALVKIREGAERGQYIVSPDGTETYVPRPDLLPWEVLRVVNVSALHADPDRLHLHAAAAKVNGAGVIVVAHAGTGKTTLSALLSSRGSTYYSDEMVAISESSSNVVSAFPKPLSLKETTVSDLSTIANLGATCRLDDGILSIVPSSLIGTFANEALTIDLIVLLTRTEHVDEPSWSAVAPMDAVVELGMQTLDMERYGDEALKTLGELALSARTIRVQAGAPMATVELLENLAAEKLPFTTRAPSVLPPVEMEHGGYPTEIRAITIDNSLALWSTSNNALVSIHGDGALATNHAILGQDRKALSELLTQLSNTNN